MKPAPRGLGFLKRFRQAIRPAVLVGLLSAHIGAAAPPAAVPYPHGNVVESIDWQLDPRFQHDAPVVVPSRPGPRPASLPGNKSGTRKIANIGVDAKWSHYGEYLRRIINTVQVQWERLLMQQSPNAAVGSKVTVKFTLNDEGKVVEIGVENTTANAKATRVCVSAITDRSPYGAWTDDMKAMLGSRQPITFTFFFQ